MAAADHGGPGVDLYRLLGVSREASRQEIAQAWRRRARDEHPDARPADADAPGRFRALTAAWQVLGDPGRRAAYDRLLAGEEQPTAPVSAPGPSDPGRAAGMTPRAGAAGPPLRAGPVRVERPYPAPPTGGWDEADVRLAVLAMLTLGYPVRDRGCP